MSPRYVEAKLVPVEPEPCKQFRQLEAEKRAIQDAAAEKSKAMRAAGKLAREVWERRKRRPGFLDSTSYNLRQEVEMLISEMEDA